MASRVSRAHVFFLPGAWHGSWCWTKHVTPLLSDLRYECVPIDYPRTFHPDPPTTFDDYVNYTLDQIQEKYEQDTAKPNIIVCHSFGGLIGTNATEKAIKERNIDIEGVIHISSILQHPSIDSDTLINSIDVLYDGKWCQLKAERAINMLYHDCKNEDIESAMSNLVPDIGLNEQWVAQYTNEGYGKVNKLYIETTEDRFLNVEWQRDIWRKLGLRREKYEVISMTTSHSPFFAQPLTLVAHLNEWMLTKTKLKLY